MKHTRLHRGIRASVAFGGKMKSSTALTTRFMRLCPISNDVGVNMISLDAMPIPLVNGKGYAWVDVADVELVSRRPWQLLKPHGDTSKTFYAACRWNVGDKQK